MPIASRALAPTAQGPLYCDASALAKLYLPESGSDALNRIVAGRSDVVVSDLAITEVASALGRRLRDSSLAAAAARQAYRQVMAHLVDGHFRRVELLAATHREAERLLLAAKVLPLRSADALHLALALSAEARTVLTFDRTMSLGAVELGLAVWPE